MSKIQIGSTMTIAAFLLLLLASKSYSFSTHSLHHRSISARWIRKSVEQRVIGFKPAASHQPHSDPLWLCHLLKRSDNENAVDSVDSSSKSASDALNPKDLLLVAFGLLIVSGVAIATSLGITATDAVEGAQRFFADPQGSLQDTIEGVRDLGPAAPIYFGLIYFLAEVLAVPATPLSLSAGYLFGMQTGVTVVLTAATLAACVGFFVGKTLLRSSVEAFLEENPRFAKIDRAVGKEGFKLLLIIRLSPIFPFSISNYVYGASSIDFVPYLFGTLFGFLPSTLAYVYTGMVGNALTLGEGSQPWYVYAAGISGLLVLVKLLADVATDVIAAVEEEEDKAAA